MKILPLKDLSESLSKILNLGVHFEVAQLNDGYTFHTIPDKDYPKQLESVLAFAKEFHKEVGIKDFLRLPVAEIIAIISVDQFLKLFIDKHEQIYSKKDEDKRFDLLKKYSFSISLGGKIPVEKIDDLEEEAIFFLKANKFDEQALFLRLQVKHTWEKGLMIPIEIEPLLFHDIPFKSLKKVDIRNNRDKITGFRFYHKKKYLFKTDVKYKLHENYTVISEGVAQYHKVKAHPLYRTLRRMPKGKEKKNFIEVQLIGGREKKVTLILKREDGSIFSLGVHRSRIYCPDPLFFKPRDSKTTNSVEIPCSKEQFRQVKKEIEDLRFRLRAERSEVDLLSVVEGVLDVHLTPLRPLVTKNFLLSYLTLPIAIKRFYSLRRRTNLPTLRSIVSKPYRKVYLHYPTLKQYFYEIEKQFADKQKKIKKGKKVKEEK